MINTRSTKEVAVIFFFWMVVAVMAIFAVINLTGGKGFQNSSSNAMYQEQGGSKESEIAGYQSILKNNPDNLSALVGLGDIYFDNNRLQEAILLFLKAEKIDPQSVHIENDLGLLYLNTSNYDSAIPKFQKALEIDPTHLDSLFYLGLTHHYKGDNVKALQTFEQVLASNPRPELIQKVNQEMSRIKGQTPLQ